MRNTKSSQMKKRICYLMAVGALIPLGLSSVAGEIEQCHRTVEY